MTVSSQSKVDCGFANKNLNYFTVGYQNNYPNKAMVMCNDEVRYHIWSCMVS